MGSQGERGGRAPVVEPQAGTIDAEQPEGLIDDVLEQPGDVAPAADLGGDPAERIGSGRSPGIGPARPRGLAGGPVLSSLLRESFVGEDHGPPCYLRGIGTGLTPSPRGTYGER